ncbi:hypothetical protein B0T14DRAFT_531275 [Immersiella caudata]|uniref:Uncharacterized protein n=1 Tax=Immersiella caudata TaxID=314043 RepID=A0AA39WAH5_9PEZI|nr:hypothetical protein B0T14DRAFT_531275 [Immersiella caudata]
MWAVGLGWTTAWAVPASRRSRGDEPVGLTAPFRCEGLSGELDRHFPIRFCVLVAIVFASPRPSEIQVRTKPQPSVVQAGKPTSLPSHGKTRGVRVGLSLHDGANVANTAVESAAQSSPGR